MATNAPLGVWMPVITTRRIAVGQDSHPNRRHVQSAGNCAVGMLNRLPEAS